MWRAWIMLALMLVAGAAAARTVEVTVEGMRLDPTTGSPVVRLVEKVDKGATARELPIWIGLFEAQAIALEMQGVPSPRPMTHDLMKHLVEQLGGKLTRVVVADLRDNTYIATLHLAGPDGKALTVDARPSDAIALALRLGGPILVQEELFARAAAVTPPTADATHLWGLTLQDLTPEIAAVLDLSDAKGVLVSDVEAAAPAREMVRGDLITALDGEPVTSLDQLSSRASSRAAGPVQLSVRRGAQRLQVNFKAD
jgi:bifunctional DNase/RNase